MREKGHITIGPVVKPFQHVKSIVETNRLEMNKNRWI